MPLVGPTLLHLAPSALAHSYRLVHYDDVASTNDEAAARALNGDAGRLWIVADQQSKGRGRHGREWVSPLGNLYASLLLIDPAPLPKAPELGFVAGVALWNALREILGDDPDLGLKWPNDILHAGAKLGGILLESAQLSSGHFACIIGIGVNCRSHPQTALYPSTDLSDIGTMLGGPDEVLIRLSDAFVKWLEIWDEARNFTAIRAEWLAHAAGLGRPISVVMPAGKRDGIFKTIDAAGRLLLSTEDQVLKVEAGDVFLHPSHVNVLTSVRDGFGHAVSRGDR